MTWHTMDPDDVLSESNFGSKKYSFFEDCEIENEKEGDVRKIMGKENLDKINKEEE